MKPKYLRGCKLYNVSDEPPERKTATPGFPQRRYRDFYGQRVEGASE